MGERVTWKWVEESLFPLVVQDARKVGVDTTGWALYPGESGRALVTMTEKKAVAKVHRRWSSARQAEEQLQAMRFAWSLLPEGM